MMWKEALAMMIIGLFHVERRKHQSNIPDDRRQVKGKLTQRQAGNILRNAIDRFDNSMKPDDGEHGAAK